MGERVHSGWWVIANLAVCLFYSAFGFWLGLNLGIAESMTVGANAACEKMRWPLVVCDKAQTPPHSVKE